MKLIRIKKIIFGAVLAGASLISLQAKELISGDILKSFAETSQWHRVDQVSLNNEDPRSFVSETSERGRILLNSDSRIKRLPYLLTKENFGDVEVSVQFMIPKGSNAGVYLMGRYEVQIIDSYEKKTVQFSDIGGIYEEWGKGGIEIGDRDLFPGKAPLVNAGKAPGEWQRVDIHFRAPRFNSAGEKIEDARFLLVYVNGELVQKDVSVPGPTVSNPVQGEAATGPVAIQGDHGPIAIRSFTVKPLIN